MSQNRSDSADPVATGHPAGCACCVAPAKAAIDHASNCGGCSACAPGQMRVKGVLAELAPVLAAKGVTI